MSEKIPSIKINRKQINKLGVIKYSSLTILFKIIQKKINIPPDKGIFFFFQFYGNCPMDYLLKNLILLKINLINIEI